ncbi:MAG TPA: histidine kinase [Chitinophagaceae bacterium]
MFEGHDLMLITTIGSILGGAFLALTIALYYISKNRKLKHAQEVMRSQLEIQRQSFNHIYHEIYDNIGQSLSLVKLNLHTVEPALPESTTEKIYSSRELVSKAIEDLRDLGRSFSTDMIQTSGLSGPIRRELLLASRAGSFETSFNETGMPFRLDPEKELVIFRLFQETLNRVAAKTKPDTVDVTLDYNAGHLTMIIYNNGNPVDTITAKSAEVFNGNHFRHMQTRAIVIGAAFQLEQLIGHTFVQIDLPVV